MTHLRPLRLGVLGLGRVVERFYLPALAQNPGLRMAAAWDPNPSRTAWLKSALPGAALVHTWDQLLDLRSLDALIIASPPVHHVEHVLSASSAGMPVLVEKPMALDVAGAMRIRGAFESTGSPIAVGFNRRFFRTYRQLKSSLAEAAAAPAGGHLEIRSAITSWNPVAGGERGWDALSDLGHHAVDQICWLFDARIARIRAWAGSRRSISEEAVELELELDNGLLVTCRLVEGAEYVERVDVRAGSETFIADSIGYRRFLNVMAGLDSMVAAGQRLIRRFLGPGNITFLSFVDELRAFETWIRLGEPPTGLATALDGAAATLAIESARQSMMQSNQFVALVNPGSDDLEGVGSPPMAENLSAQAPAAPGPAQGRPPLSVVVVVGNRRQRGAGALASLLEQEEGDSLEVVLVDAASEPNLAPLAGTEDPRVRTFVKRDGRSFGQLRAFGAGHARGRWVAFMEEHVRALPGWLRACVNHQESDWAGIGGEMHNGNPGIGVSDIIAMMNYTAWRPPAAAGETSLIPGQNNMYRREVLERYGDELSSLLENEAVFNQRLIADGEHLYLDPAIKFEHRNESRLAQICVGYFHWHRGYGANSARQHGDRLIWRLMRAGTAPLVPFVRVWRMGNQVRSLRPDELPKFLAAIPAVLVAQSAAALGIAVGALFGMGRSAVLFLDSELNIDRPLTIG